MKISYLVSIIYFFTALVCGGFALFQESEMLDIVVDDTYIVLPQSLLWILLAVIFVLFSIIGLAFELAKKPMFQVLFVIHYILTIAGLAALYYLAMTEQEAAPARYTDYSVYEDFDNAPQTIDWIPYVLYTLIGAQVVFVVNFLLSLFRKRLVKEE